MKYKITIDHNLSKWITCEYFALGFCGNRACYHQEPKRICEATVPENLLSNPHKWASMNLQSNYSTYRKIAKIILDNEIEL